MTQEQLVIRVMQIMHEWDEYNGLFWRFDDGNMRLFVMCNDQFWWACSDSEQITPENVEELAKAYQDCHDADPEGFGECWGQSLFCARVRRMRPQGCCYPGSRKLWPLFDACGPEREKDAGNPYAPGGREKRAMAESIANQIETCNVEMR